MYLQHFALTHYPFDHTLHTDELFDSRAAQEVSGRIAHLVDLRGIGLITGEVGCGKTTACRKAADQLHPSLHRVCYASLTTSTVLDTLNAIAHAMLLPGARSRGEAWIAIHQEVKRLSEEKNLLPVLIIDEAHHLRNETLEDLRLLTNYHFDSQRRMCLLLVGLTPLAQRLVMRHHFSTLEYEETCQYLSHRLEKAGAADLDHFEPQALRAIHDASYGIIRQIDRIAHYALTDAARACAKQVSTDHVQNACQEISL